MGVVPELKIVFQNILAEPKSSLTSSRVRVVVGPFAKVDEVKEAFRQFADIQGEWQDAPILPLDEFACSLIGDAEVLPLSKSSQCDALERLAALPWLLEATQGFCQFLKQRSVAKKVAQYLTKLDFSYDHAAEREAIIDALTEQDPQFATLVRAVSQLWESGELLPWGTGSLVRSAKAALDEAESLQLFGRDAKHNIVYFFGFGEMTPLLVAFTNSLSRFSQVEILKAGQISTSVILEKWKPHSAWDEAEYLKEDLKIQFQNGVSPHEIAIVFAGGELHEKAIRSQLLEDKIHERNSKDHWWIHFFKTIVSGFDLGDVRAFVGKGKSLEDFQIREKFWEKAIQWGIGSRASQWTRFVKSCGIPVPSEMLLLLQGVQSFSNITSIDDLTSAVYETKSLAARFGIHLQSDVMDRFIQELKERRPYLKFGKLRLHRILSLLEEFIESSKEIEAEEKPRNGLWFIAPDHQIPFSIRTMYVLGFNGDASVSSQTLSAIDRIVFSELEFDLAGKAAPASRFLKLREMAGENVILKNSGVASVESWNSFATISVPLQEVIYSGESLSTLRISAFEDYLRCPFLYYARHVLKLESEKDIGLDFSGSSRGTLLHKVVENIIRREIEEGMSFSFEQGKDILRESFAALLKRKPLEGTFRDPAVIEKAKDAALATVLRWWEFENKQRSKFQTLRPFRVELNVSFSLASDLLLTGRLDRVDSDGKFSSIIDYKSSKAPFIGKELASGKGVQLLAYAQAVKNQFSLEPATAYYLELGRQVQAKSGVFFRAYKDIFHDAHARNSGLISGQFDELMAQVIPVWEEAGRALKKGIYTPNPAKPSECNSCAHRNICGFEGAQDTQGVEGEDG